MKNLPFYIVDVFAEKKYAGNQLAVFMADATVPGTVMQTIARETNFAETTFILSKTPKEGGYPVRIFTPREELPFAGHPTLGTASVIRRTLMQEPAETVVLNLGVGQIPVTFGEDGVAWMRQKAPLFGPILERETVAPVLGLSPEDIDPRYPVQGVTTGVPFFLVPLPDRKTLKRARIRLDAYEAFIPGAWARSFLLFCPEGYEDGQSLGVRMFAPSFGVPEDAATGSGNGCLAGYLVQHHYFGGDEVDVVAGQGYEIERPSTLYLKAWREEGEIAVRVGGRVVDVAKGVFV